MSTRNGPQPDGGEGAESFQRTSHQLFSHNDEVDLRLRVGVEGVLHEAEVIGGPERRRSMHIISPRLVACKCRRGPATRCWTSTNRALVAPELLAEEGRGVDDSVARLDAGLGGVPARGDVLRAEARGGTREWGL